MSFWDSFLALFGFGSTATKVETKPSIEGQRNQAYAANCLQYWIDRKTNTLYFGTPLEFAAGYGGKGYSALGCSPHLDVFGVDTFGYKCGDLVHDDYYIMRGYTTENGWKWNSKHQLEYFGA